MTALLTSMWSARCLPRTRLRRRSTFIATRSGGPRRFLTWDELSDLAADGNEVGGHTPDHVDLTKLRTTEATRQVYEAGRPCSRADSPAGPALARIPGHQLRVPVRR